jgi:hypothetical protein
MPESAAAVADDDLVQAHEWDDAIGEIGIEWPVHARGTRWAIAGWGVAPFNADGPVTTISEITLHAKASGIIWAEVVMFTDEDGQPIYRTPAKLHLGEDGKPVTGTFRFLVTEMRIAAPQEIKPLKHAKRGTASNLTPKTR